MDKIHRIIFKRKSLVQIAYQKLTIGRFIKSLNRRQIESLYVCLGELLSYFHGPFPTSTTNIDYHKQQTQWEHTDGKRVLDWRKEIRSDEGFRNEVQLIKTTVFFFIVRKEVNAVGAVIATTQRNVDDGCTACLCQS
jgi:hypothetical protein